MQQKGSFNYYTSEELQAHVVELPYEGDHVSMIIILPPWLDDGLQQTVSRLTPETLQVDNQRLFRLVWCPLGILHAWG